MKRFLFKLGSFLLLQLAIFTVFWNPDLPYDRSYLAASIDKHRRLKSTPSPRIILIGGSNLAFGMKAKTLEDKLGLPVINMGLNFHLGVPFMFDEITSAIGPGDVVVLSLEHSSMASSGNELVLAEMVELRPRTLFILPFSRAKDLIDRRGVSILGGIARRNILQRFHTASENSVYTTTGRDFFDEQGTFTGHYGRGTKISLARVDAPKLSADIHDKIESFVRLCRARKALCFFTCPPQPATLVIPVPPEITENLAQLQKIEGLILLDSPLDHA